MNNAVKVLLVIALLYILYDNYSGMSVSEKRERLYYKDASEHWHNAVKTMNASEVNAVYSYIFDFVMKNRKGALPSELKAQIEIISGKYNIFTFVRK